MAPDRVIIRLSHQLLKMGKFQKNFKLKKKKSGFFLSFNRSLNLHMAITELMNCKFLPLNNMSPVSHSQPPTGTIPLYLGEFNLFGFHICMRSRNIYLSLCDLSNIMSSRSIHVITNGWIYSIVCMNHIFLTHCIHQWTCRLLWGFLLWKMLHWTWGYSIDVLLR